MREIRRGAPHSEARKRREVKPKGMMNSEARKRREQDTTPEPSDPKITRIRFRCNMPTQDLPEEAPIDIIDHQRSF